MEKRVTSHDVAELAGVSRTTVSFVFNDDKQHFVRPETRQKVREAAHQLGYYPNASARALASKQAKAIGLIMTRDPHYIAADNFLPQIIGGLLDVVKEKQISLLIEWVEPGEQTHTYLNLTQAKHIDGMILLTPRFDDPGLKALEQLGIPCVIMGQVPGSNLPFVDIDNCAAAHMAVNHLIALGHTRIACITNARLSYTSASQRLQGYRQALMDAGLNIDENLIQEADFDSASGYAAMRNLLGSGSNFSAVFAGSDAVALGALAAIHEAGLTIPGDISIVGFDDIPEAAHYFPGLTSVRVPANEIARQSCRLLMHLMKGEPLADRFILLPTELISRQSTSEIERSRKHHQGEKLVHFT
ncbi:MAG: LacI family DNA-binding transcriptional regulator [Anaerolineaceae bacterium]